SGTGISAFFAITANREKDRTDEKAAEALENAKQSRLKAAEATANAKQAAANAKRAEANAAEARENLYFAHLGLAQVAWENQHAAQVEELLDRYRQPQPGPRGDPRGWEWFYQDGLCHGDARVLLMPHGATRSVAFSPDGTRLAAGSVGHSVRVWD